MGSYPENVRKTKACLCEKFSAGGEFSQTKVADVCGSNPETPRKHLPLLQDKIICGEKKLVKVEGKNRWTLVVPDDPFESPLEEQKSKAEKSLNPAARSSRTPIYVADLLEGITPILEKHGPLRQLPRFAKHTREGGDILEGLNRYGPLRHGLMAVQEIGDTILGSVLAHEQDSTSPEDKSVYETPRRDEEEQKEMRRELERRMERLRKEA